MFGLWNPLYDNEAALQDSLHFYEHLFHGDPLHSECQTDQGPWAQSEASQVCVEQLCFTHAGKRYLASYCSLSRPATTRYAHSDTNILKFPKHELLSLRPYRTIYVASWSNVGVEIYSATILSTCLYGIEVSSQFPSVGVMSPERLEWEHIQHVLHSNNGNVSMTARQLNMHRRTLQRKLQKKPVQQ